MNRSTRIALSIAATAAVACAFVAQGFAQDTKKSTTPAAAQGAGEFQLPPGVTQQEWDACMAAGQPGEFQTWLCEGSGTWKGTTKMWMSPDATPTTTTCTAVSTPVLGGRFVETQFSGEMPGVGPFEGRGLIGHDNAAGRFQSVWCDTMGTGMMTGSGELSSDKKTLTINYTYFCPMMKKQCPMREVTSRNGTDEMVMRMWMNDPASGKEYMFMEATYKRTAKASPSTTG